MKIKFHQTRRTAKIGLTTICSGLILHTAHTAPTKETSFFDFSIAELTQVNVTSTSFFDRDALTAGSSVSVIERADWERMGARRTLDAIAHEPSVMLLPSTYGASVIAIRGYAQVGSSRGMATLVDGIPLNGIHLGSGQYNAQNINLGVLDRIEIIRGPGSALYGSDAFHGVLSMTTFEAENDISQASIEGGYNHFYQGSLQQSIGLGDHARLDVALAASGEDHDRTYQALDVSTLTKQEVNPKANYQSQTGSLKLTLDPTSELKIKGSVLIDNYDSYNYPGRFYTASTSENNTRTIAGQISATQSFNNDRSLEAQAYHIRTHSPRTGTINALAAGGLAHQYINTKEERSGATLTFRQPETERGRTEYAVAIGIEQASFTKGNLVLTPSTPPATPIQIKIGGQGEHRDIAHILLDARTAFLEDKLSVLYGGRVDHYSDMDTQASPRLGIIFQPVEDTAIKLLYHQAFRAPTFAESESVLSINSTIDPEILNSYELAFIKQRDVWHAELVLFQNDWDDGILLRVDPSVPFGAYYENSGRNRSRGLEATLGWHPGPWRVDLTGSYVKSQNLTQNEDFDLFPPIMISAGVGRAFEELNLEVYLNNHFFDGAQDVAYSATVLGSPKNLSMYWRTDLNVTKHFSSGMDMFVNIINMFDRDNRVPSVLGFSGGVADYPLSISAGVRYAF